MRAAWSVAIYLGVVFLGGALLAPGVFWLAQWGAVQVPTLGIVADHPFHRFVSRVWQGLALAGLWPLLRSLGLRSWREIGLKNPTGEWSQVGRGFALGFGSLACVTVIVLAAGAREVNADISFDRAAWTLSSAALAAVVVAVLEEVLFRGALFGTLRQAWSWPAALMASSGIYALAHFFSKPSPPAEVNWATGLILLPQMLRGFWDVGQLVPGFLALTLAGALLALAYQRTGTLFFSIGLHGGWIFWMKSYGWLTRETGAANAWLWGTRRLTDGWLALGVLSLCLIAVFRMTSRDEPCPAK
jgi:membrane protease YdiL (CAAX protease family)